MAKHTIEVKPPAEEKSPADSYVSLALGLAVVLLIGAAIFNLVSKRQPAISPEAQKTQSATESATPTTATESKIHEVAANETLWSISEQYYKSGYNWVDIQKANNLKDPNRIEKGEKLIIPVETPIVVTGQVSAASTDVHPKDANYTVVKGDSLWTISVKEYQNGYRWVDIAKANNLENPGVIHVGNVLKLP